MRTLVLSMALLAGCTTSGVLEFPTRNGLRVELGILDPAGLEHLNVRPRDLSFDAVGSDGDVAVSLPAASVGDLVRAPVDDLPVIELWSGDYADLRLGVDLAATDLPALEAWGATGDGDVHLLIDDTLSLSALGVALPIVDGVDLDVRLLLDPTDWFTGLDLPDDGFIGRNAEPELYDIVKQRISDSVVAVWPGQVGPDAFREEAASPSPADEGVGDTEGTPQAGTGAVAYRVVAEATGVDQRVGATVTYTTQARVEVSDANGQAVVGATVTLTSALFGAVALAEDPREPGVYSGEIYGYDRTFALEVSGDQGQFSATAVGPAVPTLDLGVVPVDRAQPWTIRWTPTSSAFTTLRTVGGGERQIADSGSYTVAAGVPAYQLAVVGEEAVVLERSAELALNGVEGSSFRVSVQRHSAAVDVVDSRVGAIEGSSHGLGDAGAPLRVLAWPAIVPASSPPWQFVVIDAPLDQTDWTLDLAPGEWRVQAYLDEDLSDGATPLGPDSDEPSVTAEATVSPNETLSLQLDLD